MPYFPRATVTMYHRLGGLKIWKFILSFWRLKVWNQGVKRAMVPLGKKLSLPLLTLLPEVLDIPWFATPISATSITWYCPRVSPMSAFPSSYNDTNHWIRSCCQQIWPHLNVIIFAKTLYSSKFTFTGSGWTWIGGGGGILFNPVYLVFHWFPHICRMACCCRFHLLGITRYRVMKERLSLFVFSFSK